MSEYTLVEQLLQSAKPGEKIFTSISESMLNEVYSFLRTKTSEETSELLESFVSLGLDLKQRDSDGNTFLLKALDDCYAGSNWNIVKPLLEYSKEDLDLSAVNFRDQDALSLALDYGQNLATSDINLEVVKKIIEKGANIHRVDKKGRSHLTHALFANPSLVPFLIESGVALQKEINPISEKGKAIKLPELIYFLLESKSHSNSSWEDFSRAKLVECLIQAGASIEEKDHLGRDAITIALEYNMEEELSVLVKAQRELFHQRLEKVKAEESPSKTLRL